jgi:hypothetical protein
MFDLCFGLRIGYCETGVLLLLLLLDPVCPPRRVVVGCNLLHFPIEVAEAKFLEQPTHFLTIHLLCLDISTSPHCWWDSLISNPYPSSLCESLHVACPVLINNLTIDSFHISHCHINALYLTMWSIHVCAAFIEVFGPFVFEPKSDIWVVLPLLGSSDFKSLVGEFSAGSSWVCFCRRNAQEEGIVCLTWNSQ